MLRRTFPLPKIGNSISKFDPLSSQAFISIHSSLFNIANNTADSCSSALPRLAGSLSDCCLHRAHNHWNIYQAIDDSLEPFVRLFWQGGIPNQTRPPALIESHKKDISLQCSHKMCEESASVMELNLSHKNVSGVRISSRSLLFLVPPQQWLQFLPHQLAPHC